MKNIYHIAPKRSGHSWVRTMVASWIPGVPIADLEGWYPEQVMAHYGKGVLRDGILLMQTRDLLNWYASYIRGNPQYRVGAIPTWEVITDEIYNPHYFKRGFYVVTVNYDEFVSSKTYRMQVCDQLGGTYHEKKINTVPGGGGGSTFDKFDFVGRGSQMDTCNRYKQIPKEAFIQLFNRRPTIYQFYMQHCTDNEKLKFVESLNLNP